MFDEDEFVEDDAEELVSDEAGDGADELSDPEALLPEERSREARVRARNDFIIEARESRKEDGSARSPAEIAEMIRQYDRDHPL